MTETKYTLKECGKLLVDSNILVYLADEKDLEKHTKSINIFEGLKEQTLFISAQSIREFASNCIAKKFISAETILEFIETFTSKFIIIQDDFSDTKTAVELCNGSHSLFWDASIVSVMKRKGIDCILTEDTKDFSMLGVKAINPLK